MLDGVSVANTIWPPVKESIKIADRMSLMLCLIVNSSSDRAIPQTISHFKLVGNSLVFYDSYIT